MRVAYLRGVAALAVVALSLSARADLDVSIPNNVQADLELAPADEIETLRARIPAGAKLSITVKARPEKGAVAPLLFLRLLDPNGAEVAVGTPKGKTVRLKGHVVAESGEHRVQVTGDGSASVRYQVKLRWKAAKRLRGVVTFDGGTKTVDIDADARSTARVTVKAARGAAALPRITSIAAVDPALLLDGFAPPKDGASSHSVKNITLGDALEYVVSVTDVGAGGDAATDVRLKAPKSRKTKLTLTDSAIGGGSTPGASGGPLGLVVAGLIDPSGGLIVADDIAIGALLGTQVDVPAGAVSASAAISISLATNELPPPTASLNGIGPTVFFGPSGITFDPPAVVSIPFDSAGLENNLDLVDVYARDEDGTVSLILKPYTFDLDAGLCSFPVSHFTSFRAFAPALVPSLAGEVQLVPTDAASADAVGFRVSLSGDTAVISAPSHDLPVSGGGAVYVYVRDGGGTWTFQQKLSASDATSSARFGSSVAIEGDTILVGARLARETPLLPGKVYVFTRTNDVWTEVQRLLPSVAPNSGQFGFSVALDGDRFIVGAPGQSVGGAAFIFTRTLGVWSEQQRIPYGGTSGNHRFGESVAIDGPRVVIGAPGSLLPGEAYVFDEVLGVWSETTSLAHDGGVEEEDFGDSVGLAGDIAVVGDPNLDVTDGPNNSGGVFIFERGTGDWSQVAFRELDAPHGNARFGTSLDIEGTRLVVGARGADSPGAPSAGQIDVFDREDGAWRRVLERTTNTPVTLDGLGTWLDLDGERLLAGASAITPSSGSAYIYDLELVPVVE